MGHCQALSAAAVLKPNAMSASTTDAPVNPTQRDAPRKPSAARRAANAHAQARHRRVMGLRLSAVVEVLVFVALALIVDMFLLKGQRFAGITPHPFWAIVLLAATYYGTREALFAAVVCAAVVLLLGPLPLRVAGEGGYAWLLRMVKEPLLWLLAAITLGEIRDAFRRRMIVTQELLFNAQDRVDGLTLACDRLTRQKDSLETRIADQAVTVHAIYNASRAVERDGVGEVLMGVTDLVRTTLSPQKFSLFLLNQNRLEAAVSEGWLLGDRFARVFEPGSRLHSAVVGGRRNVSVVKPEDEAMLRDEGILAGPIVNNDSGDVVGMLKIEAMDFVDLTATSVQNFQLLCAWIGASITHAQRLERMQAGSPAVSVGRIAPRSMVEPLRALMHSMAAQTGMNVSFLLIELTLDAATRSAERLTTVTRVVADALERSSDASHITCATSDHGSYMVALPHLTVDGARPVAMRIITTLRQALEDADLHAMVRHRIVPLTQVRQST
jgi:polysaccharide biosynthesis protein PelD